MNNWKVEMMTTMNVIESERLILRMFSEADLDQHAAIAADPEVQRFLAQGQPLERWAAWRQLAMMLGHWQLRGFGPWAVEEKSSGRLMGRIGFFQPEGWPGFELGWVLGREFWGKGYATEGARRALEFARDELKRDHVISLIHPDNTASIKVAERLGEKVERRVDLFGHEVLVYGLDLTDWKP